MNHRMFELTQVQTQEWAESEIKDFKKYILTFGQQADAIIAMDFGHGLWEAERIKLFGELKKFIALNVQTNSSNLGYNYFNRHENYNFLCLDERELRLGMQDRYTPINNLVIKAALEKIKSPFCITLGEQGSLIFNDGISTQLPTYFESPVDTTGAGDAFFAIASMLRYLGAPDILIPFVGNLFAGLKTKIVGNERPVSRIDLIRAVEALLK